MHANGGLDLPPDPKIYFPYSQIPFGEETTLVVRTAADPAGLAEEVRRAVREVNREAPVFAVKTMDQVLSEATAPRRFNMIIMSVFASVALMMAGIGLYGVMAYSVTERTHEIGIRIALGAQVGNILRMVVGQGLVLALIGVAVGLTGAFALTRLMTSLLYGVSATDPITFIGVAVLLVVVALLACYLPARKATKVDPMIALRYE